MIMIKKRRIKNILFKLGQEDRIKRTKNDRTKLFFNHKLVDIYPLYESL